MGSAIRMVSRRQSQRPTGKVKRAVCRRQETGAVHRRVEVDGGWLVVAGSRHGRCGGGQRPLPAGTGQDRSSPRRGRCGGRRERRIPWYCAQPGPGDAALRVLAQSLRCLGPAAGATGAVYGCLVSMVAMAM